GTRRLPRRRRLTRTSARRYTQRLPPARTRACTGRMITSPARTATSAWWPQNNRTRSRMTTATESPFSQPAADGSDDSVTGWTPTQGTDANTGNFSGNGPDSSVLISMAATLALKEGNAESIKAQLPPSLHPAFDLAYTVQSMRTDADANQAVQRQSMRTQDEVEKRRAAREAADLLVAEEKAALYSAADGDGDTLPLLSSMDLDDLPEAETLVDGFLVKESVVRLYGPPKSYKSFVMLDLAGCVAAGIPWCGKYQTSQSRVLYVVAEGVRGIKRRV